MRFDTASSPHIPAYNSVSRVMLRVLYAMLPGILALTWFFGWGVLINIALASLAALISEAAMLAIRGRPLGLFLCDGSALVTAWLLAVALPSLAPWWLTVLGVVFAIVIAKQLYGGLGYNPFNPAMVGYVVLLIAFPLEMSTWPAPQGLAQHSLSLAETARFIFTGELPPAVALDGLTGATPIDLLKTRLGLGQPASEILRTGAIFGLLGGRGWEWVSLGFLAGGLWLIYTRTAAWQIPAATLGSLGAISAVFYLSDPQSHASPWFHLFSGATMLGAFFIATDPVTASITPRGRFLYGAGIGILTYVIRGFGGYPDGVAFAVLLMNIAAPTIDYYTQPRVFGAPRG